MSQKAEGKAHGKVILIGEHSVVYDKPAIAIPFPVVNVTATIEENYTANHSIYINSKYYDGLLINAPEELSGIKACVEETFYLLNAKPKNICITISSTIPSGRGLGSSAAVAHAIVRAIFNHFDASLSKDIQMHLVQIAETHAHGNPSGIDMEATYSNAPIWFQKGKKTKALEIGSPLHLIVADSGRFGDTKTAVESIRNLYLKHPGPTRSSIDLLGEYTVECAHSLSTGDLHRIGELMNLAQIELTKLGVSDDRLEQFIQVARKNDALGAKLTGGGRGGCILALAENEQHAISLSHALKEAGAPRTWTSRLDG